MREKGNNYGYSWQRSWSGGYDDKHASPGYVYLMFGILRGFRFRLKIGLSREPKRRLQELRYDYGALVFPVFIIATNNMSRLEKAAHYRFKRYNVPELHGTGKTEWFHCNPFLLLSIISFLFFKQKHFQLYDRHLFGNR